MFEADLISHLVHSPTPIFSSLYFAPFKIANFSTKNIYLFLIKLTIDHVFFG